MKPPVPFDLDLRDFAFMPLDVARLRDSDIAALATGDAFRAAVLLWCSAWHQVPASSLPADDLNLARYSGYGRDVQGWLLVKEQALRGFDLFDDGRLYHSVIAEKAIEADQKRRSQRRRTESATAARMRKDRNKQRDVNRDVERNVVQVKGSEENKIDDGDAREHLVSRETYFLADDLAEIAGLGRDPKNLPPGWCGAPMRIQGWLDHGWPRELILIGAREAMGRKRDGPPDTVNYFEKPIARAVALAAKPLPVVVIDQTPEVIHAQANRGNIQDASKRVLERIRKLNEPAPDGICSGEGGAHVRLLSQG